MGRSHPDPARLFFSIFKLVSFKKLNKAGAEIGKFSNLHRLHFIFVFIFKFLFDFFNFNFFIFAFLFSLY